MAGKTGGSKKMIAALLSGVAVAGIGGGYLIRNDSGQPIIEALLTPDAGQNGSQNTAPGEGAKTATEGQADEKTEEAAKGSNEEVAALDNSGDKQGDAAGEAAIQPPTLPRFDLLRVERDGSTVVVGNAQPDANVEIIEGDAVLGTGKAGPGGDFAIVFDTPLSPGAHELSIRATPVAEEGKIAEPVLSAETGIVTIPEPGDAAGEVLAMVQTPGEGTRVLQQPEGQAEPEEQPVEETQVAEAETSSTDNQTPEAVTEEVQASDGEETTEKSAENTGTDNAAELDEADDPEEEAVAKAGGDAAAPAVEAAVDEKAVVQGSATPVVVQAVDVEDNRLFIAGIGETGRRVRVYIDDVFKGSTRVGPNGGFLFELNEGLVPGRHDLRVDQMLRGSQEVGSRVAVVVDHQTEAADQQVAAAEPQPEQAEPQVKPEVAETSETVPQQQVETQPAETSQAAPEPKPKEETASGSEPARKDAAEETGQPVDESKTAQTEEQAAPVTDDGKTVIQTGRSVIIRRGDNLWRISRRMLGQGRKYTLIFSANANQIRDPNKIYPGQVFEVPDDEGDESAGAANNTQ